MAGNADEFGAKKVDEGWKERAHREKEALEREKARAREAEAGSTAAGEPAGKSPEGPDEHGELPPVTFLGFVAGVAAQASVYLGLVESPFTGKKEEDLQAAGHVIDTIAMLKEKTQGNLSDTESLYLDDLLYGLRMEYVKRSKKQG